MATSLSIMSTSTYQPHNSSSPYRPHKSSSPYRPHDPGHDYHGRGTYLITLVVSGRRPLLSRFSTELGREATINHGREEAIIGNQKARYREAGIQKAGIQKAGDQEAAIGDTPPPLPNRHWRGCQAGMAENTFLAGSTRQQGCCPRLCLYARPFPWCY